MQIIFDIDELISAGTVKMSTATFSSLKLELEEQETGHHTGEVSFIHSFRHSTNEKLAREAAERRYLAEFGRPNPGAYEYYRAQDAQSSLPVDAGNPPEPEPEQSPEEQDAATLAPVPLPDHPAIENEPETPEHAYLREEEAKQP